MEKTTCLYPEWYGLRSIDKPEQIKTLSMTDIWKSKFEGKRIILDPSLFSDQK